VPYLLIDEKENGLLMNGMDDGWMDGGCGWMDGWMDGGKEDDYFSGGFVSRTKYHKIVRDHLYPEHTTYIV
jgi:hypothetical protein